MTRSQSLKARFAADSAITALIGSGSGIRMYPVIALPPDGQTTLLYKFEAKFPEYVLSGGSQIDAYLELRSLAVDYDAAHALADALLANLMPAGSPGGFRGLLGGPGGIDVTQCFIERESESFTQLSPDQGMFEILSEYTITYNQ